MLEVSYHTILNKYTYIFTISGPWTTCLTLANKRTVTKLLVSDSPFEYHLHRLSHVL